MKNLSPVWKLISFLVFTVLPAILTYYSTFKITTTMEYLQINPNLFKALAVWLFCVFCLLAYWKISDFLKQIVNKEASMNKIINDKEAALQKIIDDKNLQIKTVLEDHALRIGLYYQILMENNVEKAKIKSLYGSVTKGDLEKIGFDKTDIENKDRANGELSLREMKNSKIKELD